MEEYSFKKSTCERYDLRWGACGWATFTIDENGGLFNCQSDYGNYNYEWPNHGRESFKHFLIGITRIPDYLLGKVAKRDTFDYEKALKGWKLEIVQIRRERDCTKEQARDAWEVITDQGDYENSPDILLKEICESSAIGEITDDPWYVFEMDKEYSPQALAFANEVMPMFADILRKEIDASES